MRTTVLDLLPSSEIWAPNLVLLGVGVINGPTITEGLGEGETVLIDDFGVMWFVNFGWIVVSMEALGMALVLTTFHPRGPRVFFSTFLRSSRGPDDNG